MVSKFFHQCLSISLFIILINVFEANAQSCAPVYGFIIDETQLITYSNYVDPQTGGLTEFSEVTGTTELRSAAVDANGRRAFYIALDDANTPRLFTIDTNDGEPLNASPPQVPDIYELNYHCFNDILYAFRNQGNFVELVELDWQTGATTIVHTYNLGGVGNIKVSGSSLDPYNNVMFAIFEDSGTDNRLARYDIAADTETANDISTNVYELEYDFSDDILYGLSEEATGVNIVDINPFTGAFGATGPTIPLPAGTLQSSGTLDPFNNEFYFYTNNGEIYTVNATNASVQNTVGVSSTIYELQTAIPCEAEALFEADNTCINLPVQFIDMSIGAGSWEWDFGDSSPPSFLQNPTHTYSVLGTYTVTLTIDGCLGIDTYSIDIEIAEQPDVDLGNDIVACANNITLTAAFPGFDLEWTFGVTGNSFTIGNSGTYWLNVSNGGCTGTDTIEVTLNNPVDVNLGADQSICGTSDIELDAENAGSTYMWSTNETSQTITVDQPGIYWVEVDNGFCNDVDSIEVSVLAAFDVNLGMDTVLCEGQTIDLDAGTPEPGVTYTWNTNAVTQEITVSQSGTYSVTVSAGDCSNADTIDVNIVPIPNVDLGPDIAACDGQSVTLDAGNPGAVYNWSDNSSNQTLDITAAGTYSVTVSAGSCEADDEIEITFATASVIDLGPDQVVCADSTIVLNAGLPGASYSWSTGETSETIIASNSGNYTLTVTEGACVVTDEILITINPLPQPNLGDDRFICLVENEILEIDAGNFDSYNWLPFGETTGIIEVTDVGNYEVEVTDANGCINTDDIIITEKCAARFIMASAFSPNNDGNNDFIKPVTKFIDTYNFSIWNRWGQLVFESTDPTEEWDGRFKNQKQPVGVFVWHLNFINEDGEEIKRQGNLTLIR